MITGKIIFGLKKILILIGLCFLFTGTTKAVFLDDLQNINYSVDNLQLTGIYLESVNFSSKQSIVSGSSSIVNDSIILNPQEESLKSEEI